jgi:hypothetical protein
MPTSFRCFGYPLSSYLRAMRVCPSTGWVARQH